MRRGFQARYSTSLRYALLTGSLTLGVAGCANFWDDVTSREFQVKNLYTSPDPMTTLRENTDGDARARAMKALKEPAKNGKPQDQDDAVNLLGQAAIADPRPLCRLAAISALGRFEDARTAAPLVQAYQAAGDKSFGPDIANSIRCQALSALGNKNTPESAALLIQVVAQPKAAAPNATLLTGFNGADPLKKPAGLESDDPGVRNERLAAIRSLGQSHNMQAVPALIQLVGEKDVAVRDRAQEALQKLTSRTDVPAEPQAWQTALANGTPAGKRP